jgi:uncharacterized membrane protein
MQTTSFALIQSVALILIGLVVGTMFGIWQGYNILEYSPRTFLETHQGAVRGLNTLLPSMALCALALVLLLAYLSRRRPAAMWLYLAAAAAIMVGGLVTRFANQPINAQVMTWTPTSLPADWNDVRTQWWNWHLVRLATTFIAEGLLLAAFMVRQRP